jgi:MYXO-CTERM domain-containing protein
VLPCSPTRITIAVGAACLAGFHPSASAALIDYSFSGRVTEYIYDGAIRCFDPVTFQPCPDPPNPIPNAQNNPFNASLRLDTSTGSVVTFSYSVNGGGWTGTGGSVTASSTSFDVDLSRGVNYTSEALAGVLGFNMLDLVGPAGAFSDFIDGYATTFNIGAMSTRGGQGVYCRSPAGRITVSLTAASGELVPGSDAKVPEPGTVALAGLAGLAALRSVRRRKAAAA